MTHWLIHLSSKLSGPKVKKMEIKATDCSVSNDGSLLLTDYSHLDSDGKIMVRVIKIFAAGTWVFVERMSENEHSN